MFFPDRSIKIARFIYRSFFFYNYEPVVNYGHGFLISTLPPLNPRTLYHSDPFYSRHLEDIMRTINVTTLSMVPDLDPHLIINDSNTITCYIIMWVTYLYIYLQIMVHNLLSFPINNS